MKTEISRSRIKILVAMQIKNLFGLHNHEKKTLWTAVDVALKRCGYCFSHVTNKYYRKDGEVYFNPFHSGQYSIFLYFLSNSIFVDGKATDRTLADRVYYLNKALNGLDLFYEVAMPGIFFLDHPVGSVIGRATFGDYFFFSQNCTVGNNKGIFPQLGKNVRMMSGAKIIGNSRIGDNVIVSANTYVKDCDVSSDSMVFGSSPKLVIVPRDAS